MHRVTANKQLAKDGQRHIILKKVREIWSEKPWKSPGILLPRITGHPEVK